MKMKQELSLKHFLEFTNEKEYENKECDYENMELSRVFQCMKIGIQCKQDRLGINAGHKPVVNAKQNKQ